MKTQFDFYFAANHCTEAAVRFLKEQFRKAPYSQVSAEYADEIAYLLNPMKYYFGKTPAQVYRIFRMTSEAAGMYDGK